MWGLASIYSYRAYGDPNFMEIATTVWTQYASLVISSKDADAGTHPSKNITFPSQCNGGEFYLCDRI